MRPPCAATAAATPANGRANRDQYLWVPFGQGGAGLRGSCARENGFFHVSTAFLERLRLTEKPRAVLGSEQPFKL